MGFSVDHSSIFSLFSPNFSHVDNKEYLIYQTSEYYKIVIVGHKN